MIIVSIIFIAFLLFTLNYGFNAWIKPSIVHHADWQFEPGPDSDVSWREMWRRNAWRYDSWTDRIMSLVLFVILMICWIMILMGK